MQSIYILYTLIYFIFCYRTWTALSVVSHSVTRVLVDSSGRAEDVLLLGEGQHIFSFLGRFHAGNPRSMGWVFAFADFVRFNCFQQLFFLFYLWLPFLIYYFSFFLVYVIFCFYFSLLPPAARLLTRQVSPDLAKAIELYEWPPDPESIEASRLAYEDRLRKLAFEQAVEAETLEQRDDCYHICCHPVWITFTGTLRCLRMH